MSMTNNTTKFKTTDIHKWDFATCKKVYMSLEYKGSNEWESPLADDWLDNEDHHCLVSCLAHFACIEIAPSLGSEPLED